jgi:hypothetical protein
VCGITGGDFNGLYNQSEGTLFSTASTFLPLTSIRRIVFATDGTFANRVGLLFNTVGQPSTFLTSSGGSLSALIDSPVVSIASPVKIAGAYKLDDFAISANGSAVTTDTTGPVGIGINRLSIGSQNDIELINGHIAALRYYKKRLPNAKLQSLTYPDDDADAYIAAVEAALGTSIYLALPNATSDVKRIITDFYKAEKSAGRYSLHKRIYLPIYNNLAANAVDMVTTTSGTFVNTPTTAMGYVMGNGSNQYFNINTTLRALGLTSSNASYIMGLKSESLLNNRGNSGALDASGYFVDFRFDIASGRRLTWLQPDTNPSGTFDTSQRTGVIVTNRTSSLEYTIHNDTADLGTKIYASGLPEVNPFIMARNNNGNPDLFGNSEIGFFGFGLGMSVSNARAYAAAMKNLWENLTGLTLP